MNSIASSSCLMAVIAIFITVTAVMSYVSPPAKIAGHNANSSIKKDVVVRITDSSTIATTSPSLHFTLATDNSSYDGANHAPKNDGNHDNVPVVSETLTKTAWYRLTFVVLNILSCCLMMITMFVYNLSESKDHSRYLPNLALGVAFSHFIAFFTVCLGQEIDADFKLTVLSKLLIIINTHGWQLVINIELYTLLKSMYNISKNKKEILKRTTYFHKYRWFFQIISIDYCCIDILHQVDLKILGVQQIHIKPSLFLTELTPGLVNIMFYVYFFICNKISRHLNLLSVCKKRIATRNLMFKLSLLMFTVDSLYFLDITMGWNYNAIHILRLLKSARGLFIFIVILFRPFAPVLYDALLKRLRRRIIIENEEETDKPISYIIITEFVTTV